MRDNGIVPLCVFGGWRQARELSQRTPDGWEVEWDTNELDPTVWPTLAECQAAIRKAEA